MFEPFFSIPNVGVDISVPADDSKFKPSPAITLCTVPALLVALMVTLPTPVLGVKVILVPATKEVTPEFVTVTLPVAALTVIPVPPIIEVTADAAPGIFTVTSLPEAVAVTPEPVKLKESA